MRGLALRLGLVMSLAAANGAMLSWNGITAVECVLSTLYAVCFCALYTRCTWNTTNKKKSGLGQDILT